MNLVIDIGNTRTKFSIFNRGEMIITVPVDQFGIEQLEILRGEYPSLKNVILSSVKKYSSDLKKIFKNILKITLNWMKLHHFQSKTVINQKIHLEKTG